MPEKKRRAAVLSNWSSFFSALLDGEREGEVGIL
jgi:hypothetical protein